MVVETQKYSNDEKLTSGVLNQPIAASLQTVIDRTTLKLQPTVKSGQNKQLVGKHGHPNNGKLL